MLYIIENNSRITPYFSQDLLPRLTPYFNQKQCSSLEDFLNQKVQLSIHKFLLIDITDLSSTSYENLASKVADYFGVCYFFQDRSKVDFEKLKVLISNNCLGVVDLTLPKNAYLVLFQNMAKYIDSDMDLIDAEEIKDLNKNLGLLVSKVEQEMFRLKRMHHSLMPRREQIFTNVKVQSKFATGESAGGEFFDIIEDKQKLIIFLGASNSYLTSSMSSSIFSQVKELSEFNLGTFENIVFSVQSMLASLQQSNKKKTLTYDLFLAVLDLKDLSMTGVNFGNHVLITSAGQLVGTNEFPVDKGLAKTASFQLKLNRGEEVALISSGIKKNSKEYLKDRNYLEFIKEKLSKEPQEFFDEIYFELRKSASSEFLAHDASLIRFQVDQKAITWA